MLLFFPKESPVLQHETSQGDQEQQCAAETSKQTASEPAGDMGENSPKISLFGKLFKKKTESPAVEEKTQQIDPENVTHLAVSIN